ncbi:MAG: hypothetical protein IIC35_03645, partial [Gemmatimonadetes bacterium]|nr:hypothetical protein [Gemmatimonadota bacterium]
MRRLLARPEAALFALVLAPYVFFYQAGGWNQNSRFDLVRAIVEQQSFEIDSFTCSNPHAPNVPSHLNTGDVSCRGPNGRCQVASALGDRTYCDKAPGVSFLAVPVYAAVYLVAGGGPGPPSPRYLAGASHLVTIWSAGIPAAIAVAMIFLLLGTLGVGRPTQLAVSLAYGLGTITFPYATLLYGNSLAAALLVIAFALLVRARRGDTATGPARLIGIGLILSFSIVVEYSAVLVQGTPHTIFGVDTSRPSLSGPNETANRVANGSGTIGFDPGTSGVLAGTSPSSSMSSFTSNVPPDMATLLHMVSESVSDLGQILA